MNKLLLLFLTLLTACNGSSPTATPVLSAWGAIITLGAAEQMDAPAVWPLADRVTTAWIGADETGIHQDIRTIATEGLSATVVLPLPPRNPYAQQLFPATSDNLHLLWLDADVNGEVRLYSALITANLEVERGPTLITQQFTRRYAISPNGDGSLWAISSGGLSIEPRLFANYIDHQGRPRLEANAPIAIDADWPTLTRSNAGVVSLFWIRPSDGRVMQSTLTEGLSFQPQPITETVPLNPGDRLVSFRGGLDYTHHYLFWNINRADGTTESWMATSPLDTPTWEMPIRLGYSSTKGNFETGFNSGSANAARSGDNWLSWTAPMGGQSDNLPAAVVYDGQLSIIYLQQGAVAGYQTIVPVRGLIGMPMLFTDRNRFLYLAWSEPGATGKADLNLTTTRRFS